MPFPSRFHVLFISLTACTLLSQGCRKSEPPRQSTKADVAQSHPISKEMTVVVPPQVKNTWKSVRISVTDKGSNRQTSYAVPIGGDITVPGTGMKIAVEYFLPAFIMEGSVMTSDSNELRNPGARVTITDNGSTIFKGWLFSKHPSAHAFMHPVYGFALTEVIPVR